MKKFIRKSPPKIETNDFTPVSILKKPRVTEAVNNGLRKVVMIEDKSPEETDSEDSAMCMRGEEEEREWVEVSPAPGSVADRERRKWVEKAVCLSNNPYSKENIVRRKSSTNGGDYMSLRHSYEGDADIDSYEKEGSDISSLYVSMYKRDYYIHHDNNNEEPVRKILPVERNRTRPADLKPPPVKIMTDSSSLFSPDIENNREDSEDNLESDSLDEDGPVADSGVSEAGSQVSEEPSEVSTISVSEEIKKFQRDINTVATENTKFFTWKQQRVGQVRRHSGSSENLRDDAGSKRKLSYSSSNSSCPEEASEVEVVSSQYSDKEVTVLGLPEEVPPNLVVKAPNFKQNFAPDRSRQIQPSSHVAPSYLPSGEATETGGNVNTDNTEELSGEDEDEVPALPSVKTLTNKFQAFSCNINQEKVKESRGPVRLPVMVKKRYVSNKNNNNNSAYKQVHSITARSVSRQFRESLKAGKAELVDTIFKLPPGDQSSRHQETVTNIINDKANVVYNSKSPHDLFPDGDYVRGELSSSDESDHHQATRHW